MNPKESLSELNSFDDSAPCRFIVTNKDGTSYCSLAESSVSKLREALLASEQRNRELLAILEECKFLAAHGIGSVGGDPENEKRNIAEIRRIQGLIESAMKEKVK